ncbi:MAG: GNAT family N-acetyltransferase [Leptolyngbya sp.]|nr:GNAT family N-acetyltransferase [Leptolyngbya sp.]
MAESTANRFPWAKAPSETKPARDESVAEVRPTAHIRLASLGDLDQLTDVLVSSFYDGTGWLAWLYPLMKLGIQEDLKQRLKTDRHGYACLAVVAVESLPQADSGLGQEIIVGTVEMTQRQTWPWQSSGGRYVYISNLAVSQTWRRRGFAAQLLAACETLALTWQFDHLYLHVMEDNPGAQRLYRRLGFEVSQAEEGLAVWLGLQPRRLLLKKRVAAPPPSVHP